MKRGKGAKCDPTLWSVCRPSISEYEGVRVHLPVRSRLRRGLPVTSGMCVGTSSDARFRRKGVGRVARGWLDVCPCVSEMFCRNLW